LYFIGRECRSYRNPVIESISPAPGISTIGHVIPTDEEKFFLCFAIALLTSWVGIGLSQEGTKSKGPQKSKVHPEVWRKVQEKGVVDVIVELDMPWRSEPKLSKDEIPAQRKAIAEAQKRLLAELAGTKFKLVRGLQKSPIIGLEVDSYALKILENSPLVLRVNESLSGEISLLRSVPLVGVGPSTTGGFDGAGFAVAILDTGVDKNHPFLQGKVHRGMVFLNERQLPWWRPDRGWRRHRPPLYLFG
jgi:hypothetical protein